MSQNLQILVPVDSVTYTDVQRLELLDFQDLPAWEADGAYFLTRADVCAVPGPMGYDAQWANQLPGKTDVARLADTAVGTLTPTAGNPAILGGRPTILANGVTDIRMAMSAFDFPTTGPFWIYVAVNAINALFQLGGNYSSSSLLRLNFTNNDIRLLISNTVSLTATLGSLVSGRDIVVGFGRTTDGHLRIRYKLRGLPWVEVTSPSVQAGAVNADFAFGVPAVSGSYTTNGYWGMMYLANHDITGGTQAQVESYFANYYGMN